MPRTLVDKTSYMISRFNDFVRGELSRQKLSQQNLADYLGMSRSSVTLRLNGEVKWTIEEVLETLEFLGVDTLRLYTFLLTEGSELFERRRINDKGIKKGIRLY